MFVVEMPAKRTGAGARFDGGASLDMIRPFSVFTS